MNTLIDFSNYKMSYCSADGICFDEGSIFIHKSHDSLVDLPFIIELTNRCIGNLRDEYFETNGMEYSTKIGNLQMRDGLPYSGKNRLKKEEFVSVIVKDGTHQYHRFIHRVLLRAMIPNVQIKNDVLVLKTTMESPNDIIEADLIIYLLELIYANGINIGEKYGVIPTFSNSKMLDIPDLLILMSLFNRFNMNVGIPVQCNYDEIDVSQVFNYIRGNKLTLGPYLFLFLRNLNAIHLNLNNIHDEDKSLLLTAINERFLKMEIISSRTVNYQIPENHTELMWNCLEKNIKFNIRGTPFTVSQILLEMTKRAFNNPTADVFRRIYDLPTWLEFIEDPTMSSSVENIYGRNVEDTINYMKTNVEKLLSENTDRYLQILNSYISTKRDLHNFEDAWEYFSKEIAPKVKKGVKIPPKPKMKKSTSEEPQAVVKRIPLKTPVKRVIMKKN